MNNEYINTIQVRIGRALIEKIDQAAEQASSSRNYWIVKQARWLLTHPPVPLSVTASILLADKQMMMIRMPKKLTRKVDRECEKLGIPRTLWLMDACLSGLRNRQLSVRRSKKSKT